MLQTTHNVDMEKVKRAIGDMFPFTAKCLF